jgi:CDP-glucose 4,6-dehydratase
LDLVHRICKEAGKPALVPKLLNEANHEIRQQYLDCSKAKRMLGWQPEYTLEAGLRETIGWYRQWLNESR